jgi:hypothetical protein
MVNGSVDQSMIRYGTFHSRYSSRFSVRSRRRVEGDDRDVRHDQCLLTDDHVHPGEHLQSGGEMGSDQVGAVRGDPSAEVA